jgi:D-alanyl-D-alanine-carboxypeptidase/D-alanyl-D-alanine-endopeptidase
MSQLDLSPIVAAAEQFATEARLPGASLLMIDTRGQVLLEHYIGGWDESTTVPVASASKWWAAATTMALVDAGLFKLDDSVAQHLPEFRQQGPKSQITVRDTLRFTAGFASHIAMQDDPSISQADLVRHLAQDVDLLRDPGTAFHYGGLQMEIAGRIAEVVTGEPYARVFAKRIVEPLGLLDTRLANLRNRRPSDLVFDTANPLVPGGIVSSVRDYRRFLEMLLNDGNFRGTRVLSVPAIDEMLRDQTGELPIAHSIQQDTSYHYALGAWHRVHPESGDIIVSSSGALGTAPWINRSRGYAAVFLTRGRAGQSAAFLWRFMDLVSEVMRDAGFGGGAAARVKAGASDRSSQLPRRRPERREGRLVEVIERLEIEDSNRRRIIPLRVLYPASEGSYPLIVFSHFAGGSRRHYDPLVQYWAGGGYVVILPDHCDSTDVDAGRHSADLAVWRNRAGDITFILDALDQITAAAPALRGRIDDSRIGVGGHGLGAHTANLISGMRMVDAPSFRDERVDAVLLMAPPGIGQGLTSTSWRSIRIPSLTVVGSKQGSNRPRRSAVWRNASFYYGPAGDRYLLTVEGMGAGYAGLVAGQRIPEGGDPTHARLLRTTTLAYWDVYLAQDTAAQTGLTAAAVRRLAGDTASLSIR